MTATFTWSVACYNPNTLHKKWSFPLRISSVNVTKYAENSDLVTFTGEILNGKLNFLCRDGFNLRPWSPYNALRNLIPLVQFEKREKIYGGARLLVKLLVKACNFTKINTPLWVFFKFFKLCKWLQIAQSVSMMKCFARRSHDLREVVLPGDQERNLERIGIRSLNTWKSLLDSVRLIIMLAHYFYC